MYAMNHNNNKGKTLEDMLGDIQKGGLSPFQRLRTCKVRQVLTTRFGFVVNASSATATSSCRSTATVPFQV
jgi:hypothetical protein